MERKPGFYWVLCDLAYDWKVAEWDKGWYLPGIEYELNEGEFADIGPRIIPPYTKPKIDKPEEDRVGC